MAWDFSTEPEFQEQLDWVEQFCREEVEPLELVFPYAVRIRDPKMRALVDPLQDQVKEQGLWAIFLDKELGGPGVRPAQVGPAQRDPRPLRHGPLDLRLPGPRHRQHGDPGRLRHRGAEGAVALPAHEPGDLVGLLHDRARGRLGPRTCSRPPRCGTARSG